MKSISCDIRFYDQLRSGDKNIFIEKILTKDINGKTKKIKYSPYDDLEIYVRDAKNKRFVGYTKIMRIKEMLGKDLYNASLKDVARFRAWITFSNRYGFKTVQQLMEELDDVLGIGEDDTFQLLEVYPLSKTPYTNGV